MPEFKEVANFPSEADNLTNLPLFQLGKWLFTSLHPAAAAEDFFGGIRERVGWMPFEEFHFRPELSQDYTVDAHWALYCENYLEGFHIPFVHHSLNEIVDYGTYTTETFHYSSLQTGYDSKSEVAGRYLFIFPNLMF